MTDSFEQQKLEKTTKEDMNSMSKNMVCTVVFISCLRSLCDTSLVQFIFCIQFTSQQISFYNALMHIDINLERILHTNELLLTSTFEIFRYILLHNEKGDFYAFVHCGHYCRRLANILILKMQSIDRQILMNSILGIR